MGHDHGFGAAAGQARKSYFSSHLGGERGGVRNRRSLVCILSAPHSSNARTGPRVMKSNEGDQAGIRMVDSKNRLAALGAGYLVRKVTKFGSHQLRIEPWT